MPNARRSHVSEIDGRFVEMQVDILDQPARERLAASIAWLAEQEGEAGLSAWEAFATDIVGAHVDFTIDERDLDAVDGIWWGQAIFSAATALMDVNGLAPEIRRSLAGVHPTGPRLRGSGRVC